MTELLIVAIGTPVTQGSKRPAASKRNPNAKGVRDSNDKILRPWRKTLADAARAAKDGHLRVGRFDEDIARMVARLLTPGTPARVTVTVSLRRPKHHYRTGRFALLVRDAAPPWPSGSGTGDSDKYLRAVLDALTDAGVWHDDCQAVETTSRKVWCAEGHDALGQPGVVIRVSALDPAHPDQLPLSPAEVLASGRVR